MTNDNDKSERYFYRKIERGIHVANIWREETEEGTFYSFELDRKPSEGRFYDEPDIYYLQELLDDVAEAMGYRRRDRSE